MEYESFEEYKRLPPERELIACLDCGKWHLLECGKVLLNPLCAHFSDVDGRIRELFVNLGQCPAVVKFDVVLNHHVYGERAPFLLERVLNPSPHLRGRAWVRVVDKGYAVLTKDKVRVVRRAVQRVAVIRSNVPVEHAYPVDAIPDPYSISFHGTTLSLIHISEPTRLGMISYAV